MKNFCSVVCCLMLFAIAVFSLACCNDADAGFRVTNAPAARALQFADHAAAAALGVHHGRAARNLDFDDLVRANRINRLANHRHDLDLNDLVRAQARALNINRFNAFGSRTVVDRRGNVFEVDVLGNVRLVSGNGFGSFGLASYGVRGFNALDFRHSCR